MGSGAFLNVWKHHLLYQNEVAKGFTQSYLIHMSTQQFFEGTEIITKRIIVERSLNWEISHFFFEF